jgi:hypothetical protein
MSHPTIAAPLSRTTTLVAVTISQWTARKLDKDITDDTNKRLGASADAGRYNKLLIESKRLEKLNALVSAARDLHYSMTKPWIDKGPRILPNALFAKFSEKFRELKREFNIEADAFARAYPDYVAERRIKLNGAFKEKDYPSSSEIRDKFQLDMKVLPFPEATDFRADLDADVVADIKRELEESTVSVTEDAMKHTYRQIAETVGHMAEKLKEYGVKKGASNRGSWFADTLVENVRELAELLPAFNLTGDVKLAEITERISRDLCTEEPEELRDNPKVRADVAKSADAIVAEVSKFLA